jgi:hypothetical protein
MTLYFATNSTKITVEINLNTARMTRIAVILPQTMVNKYEI